MSICVVRAGRHGEREEAALEKSMALIGWDELPDLSSVTTRDALSQLMKDTYPDGGPKVVSPARNPAGAAC
jgi:restriction system protein